MNFLSVQFELSAFLFCFRKHIARVVCSVSVCSGIFPKMKLKLSNIRKLWHLLSRLLYRQKTRYLYFRTGWMPRCQTQVGHLEPVKLESLKHYPRTKTSSFKLNLLNKIVLHTLEGSIPLLSEPLVKKEPITAQIVCDIYDKYGKSESISDLRVCTMCLWGYSGCLRFQELVSLKMFDFWFFSDYLEIIIRSSKTDIYRQVNKLIIAKTGNSTCPVKCLEHYIRAAKLQYNSDLFLFRPIGFHKNSNYYCLSSRNVFISYTRAREIILNAFISIGLEKSKFGLHSLRSGGATAAAAMLCWLEFYTTGRATQVRQVEG